MPRKPKLQIGTLDRKTYEKNLANMKLLISYQPFQEEVRRIRKYLKIPEDGFPGSNPAIEQWTHDMDTRSDEMMSSEKFRNLVRGIRNRFRNHEISPRQAEMQSKLIHHEIPWNFLTQEVGFLMEKFGMPRNYEQHIRDFIVVGRINAPFHNFVFTFEPPGTMEEMRKKNVTVVIYSRPTNHEFEEMEREIRRWARLLPRFRPLKNIDTKLTLEQWLKDREKYDSVEDRTYIMPAKEIAENVLNDKRKRQRVYDARRELESIRKKRFGKN